MPAPEIIERNVELFASNKHFYTSKAFNETQVRSIFIDDFFGALGWPMKDAQQVVREISVDVEEADRTVRKHPDYGFIVNRNLRFYVEAKAPHVDLNQKNYPAFQVRRYGWSAKLPASILTDFQEFGIYDCRVKPDAGDKPKEGRLRYYTFDQYIEKWDEISSLLSYEAVRYNALDNWVRETKTRGIEPVDQAFLSQLESWRLLLARDIARHNPSVRGNVRQLNMAVQLTIDRIVFLRICEDRDIEPHGRLGDLTLVTGIYNELKRLFLSADAKYNSGLFHFHKETGREEVDSLTLNLHISDEALRQILSNLYPPLSPYAFDVIAPELLGQIYERFLGKVITVDTGGNLEVVEKPEVRKAGGVFYTPIHIVNYIVEQTIDPLIDGKTPDQVAAFRVLDPACGSGSFLLGAYQYLLDWHLTWYLQNDASKHLKAGRLQVRPVPDGDIVYNLTVEEKKRILVNNIYGVDLDQQAVEVTKLSLLLKVLEGENAVSSQPLLMADRVLPDLNDNIKWGNSLIDSTFYGNQELPKAEEDLLKVKVFDWHDGTDGFGEIIARGGFDALIGNPPYIRIQTVKEWFPESIEFYKQHYVSAQKGNYDTYAVFIEKGLRLLNRAGRLGFIVPHKFFNAQYGEPLRKLLANGKHISRIIHFGHQQVFSGATTYTCLLFLNKAGAEEFELTTVEDLAAWELGETANQGYIKSDKLNAQEWNFSVSQSAKLFDRLSIMPAKLGDLANRMAQGIRTSANNVYVLDVQSATETLLEAFSPSLNTTVEIERAATLSFLQGREIKAYHVLDSGKVVILPYITKHGKITLISEEDMKAVWPNAFAYLSANREYLEGREHGRMQGAGWYGYVYPKNIELMTTGKILVPDIASRASFAFDRAGQYAFTSGYGITLNPDVEEAPEYLLGLMNSRLLDVYLKHISTVMRGGYFRYFTQFIQQLPIRRINFGDEAEKAIHDELVNLVKMLLQRYQELPHVDNQQAKKIIQNMIATHEQRIDQLVYQLYEVTIAEQKLIDDTRFVDQQAQNSVEVEATGIAL